MGYLPQFKNDLFISYRRVANEGPDKWVEAFCNQLKTSLDEMLQVGKDDVDIWRDGDQLRGGEIFGNDIAQVLDNTAIFLAVISRSYFDSDECIKELDQFLGKLKDPTGGSERRLVPVFKQPQDPDQPLPQEISKLNHHFFFRMDSKDSIHWREYGPADYQDIGDFRANLARVAQDLQGMLKTLRGYARQRLGTVFVSRVSSELQNERDRLRSDLLQRGYLVVPEQPYVWNSDDTRGKIARDLEVAQLSIHLVSGASNNPADDKHARLQLEIAHDAMKLRKLPAPMVWIKPSDKVPETDRELIDFIKNNLANKGVDYFQSSFEEFKRDIVDKLRPVQCQQPPLPVHEIAPVYKEGHSAVPPVRPQAATSPVREIALLVEEEDVYELGDIKTLMVEKLFLEPKPVKFNGTSPKDGARLARTLADTKQCMIFWGKQSEEWVLDLLGDKALTGSLGKDRMCVYAAGPVTAEKEAFQTTKAHTILAADDLSEQAIRTFFAAGVIAS
jgi:hypothetical protein